MEERAATRFKNESVWLHVSLNRRWCNSPVVPTHLPRHKCHWGGKEERLLWPPASPRNFWFPSGRLSLHMNPASHCGDWGNDGKLIFKGIVWSFLKDFFKRKYKHVDIDVARILLHFPVALVHFVQWYGGERLIRAIPKLPWQLAKVSNECYDLITAADVFGYVAWHEKMMTVTTWIIQSDDLDASTFLFTDSQHPTKQANCLSLDQSCCWRQMIITTRTPMTTIPSL